MVMMTLYAKQQNRHRCKEQTDSVGEGEGGMIWENSIETCISYVKQIASPDLMHETWCQGWCTGMTLRDGMGR